MGKTARKTTQEFIEKAIAVHGDKYDYSLVEYVNSRTKVPIICPKHGEFWQKPNDHLNNHGCKKCWIESHKKVLFGVGINDYKYTIRENGKEIKSYYIWRGMLQRCYSNKYQEKYPTYIGCTVCNEWRYFSNFKEWFDNPENGYKEGYHLDKDILVKGNKVYSPDTCCFVPQYINSLFTKRNSKRGYLPIGVTKSSNKYCSKVRIYNNIYLGLFTTPDLAFEAYKEAKEAQIKEVAESYYKDNKITEKVYNALLKYEVEITD